ncbi:MAG: hypothetical protein MUC50_01120 [Myxococcota bacterium]|jgi:hypothetical protein|nr:hypothetical protein [Myxococcota bacterium]
MSAHGNTKKTGFRGTIVRFFLLSALGVGGYFGFQFYQNMREMEVLKSMISRLTAEDRVAEVWVKDYEKDAAGRPSKLTLKILEKDGKGNSLPPVFCTFSLNDIIHFEALVIRLNDEMVMNGEGKSIYLFRRAYALKEGGNIYESCDINKPMEVPQGYALGDTDRYVSDVEQKYWKSFWSYALDPTKRQEAGVKNAQIEAPATKFVENIIYRIILEHDGGLRIEASPIPEILKGEQVD